jgi:hypothetical protein
MMSWFASFDFVTWWKATSIFFTGLFGVLGLLTEYKNKTTGKITRWGWISLLGILLSTVCGVAAQIKETSDQQIARDASAKQTIQMLSGIQRSLTILDEPVLRAMFHVPCEDIYVGVCADVESWKKGGGRGPLPPSIWSKWPGNPPAALLIGIFLYRDAKEAERGLINPDWYMNFLGPATAWLDPSEKDSLSISLAQPVRPSLNQNNGNLVSFDDLKSAYLVVSASPPMLPGSTPKFLRPTFIRLEFRNGRSIGAVKSAFTQSANGTFQAPLSTKDQTPNAKEEN